MSPEEEGPTNHKQGHFRVSNSEKITNLPHQVVNSLDLYDLNLHQPYPIPPSTANLPFLNFLYLSRIPNVVRISFDGNRLTGTNPDSYGSFSKLFTSITLSRNCLFGKIPVSLAKLNLAFVDFSRNGLERCCLGR
ncbi:Leucine-rich repeat domain superfamily [Sesbania bispinosa]|nr:Leucine-rich repeat domain superfamily [Sesbania bispinosa]